MGYTKEEAQEFLSRKVRVTFRKRGETEEFGGHVEEVALSLYAEGRLDFLPLYKMDGEKLKVCYLYAKDVRCLGAYPPDLGKFEDEATPGAMDELIENIESTHPPEQQTIAPVPVQKEMPDKE